MIKQLVILNIAHIVFLIKMMIMKFVIYVNLVMLFTKKMIVTNIKNVQKIKKVAIIAGVKMVMEIVCHVLIVNKYQMERNVLILKR